MTGSPRTAGRSSRDLPRTVLLAVALALVAGCADSSDGDPAPQDAAPSPISGLPAGRTAGDRAPSAATGSASPSLAAPDPSTPDGAAARRASSPPTNALPIDAMFDELAAIGYADFSTAGPNALGAGVVGYDAERSVPGYNLVTSIPAAAAVLLDAQGQEVHRWSNSCERWMRVRLLDEGALLVVGVCDGADERLPFLIRLEWDGSETWRLPVPVHHDLDVLPNGRILVLSKYSLARPGYCTSGLVRDNELVMISPDGELIAARSVTDLIDRGPAPFTWLPAESIPGHDEQDEFFQPDYLHCNSVVWLHKGNTPPDHPLLKPGRVLLSSRHQNALLLIDWSDRELVWSWGQDTLQLQHEASPLPNGHVLLFDNGTAERGWSRLVELDPVAGEIVWQWTREPPEDFYSSGRGTVQRLRGGNLLVGNSASGEAFEITREGQLVWRYFNTDTDETGAPAALRIERYPVGLVQAILRAQGEG